MPREFVAKCIADSGDVNGPFRREVNKIGAKRRGPL